MNRDVEKQILNPQEANCKKTFKVKPQTSFNGSTSSKHTLKWMPNKGSPQLKTHPNPNPQANA